jgi:hypothetical protein
MSVMSIASPLRTPLRRALLRVALERSDHGGERENCD